MGFVEEWLAFVGKSLALDSLAKHFQGIVPAIACMLAMTSACLLVYPVSTWTTRKALASASEPRKGNKSLPTVVAGLISVGFPSALAWGVAVWGAGSFRWGFASGVGVGLHCAALTLKSWSFFQEASATGARSELAPAGDLFVDGKEVAIPKTVVSGPVSGSNGPFTSSLDESMDSWKRSAAPSMVPVDNTVTFWGFVFFLLCVPSLVCKPPLLRRSAWVRADVSAAASEILHAALAYLVVHNAAVVVFAPVLRVLNAAYESPSWVEFDRAMVALCLGEGGDADGSGTNQLMATICRLGQLPEAGDLQRLAGLEPETIVALGRFGQVGSAAVIAMCVGSPIVHFLMFYAFFHCVSLSSAEFWGYPDRDFYGPWWLAAGDAKAFYRMWSAPVSRWLNACIYRPMLRGSNRPELTRSAGANRSALPPSGASKDIDLAGVSGNRKLDRRAGAEGCEGMTSRESSGTVMGVRSARSKLWHVVTLICVFLVSGVIHEAVAYIAMRRTFCPINTICLMFASTSVAYWDVLFPPREPRPNRSGAITDKSGADDRPGDEPRNAAEGFKKAGQDRTSRNTGANSSAGGDVGDGERTTEPIRACGKRSRPPVGSPRGWVAVAWYTATYVPGAMLCDAALWRWWVRVHGSDGVAVDVD